MHYERENDGTIAITDNVKQPMQGTFVGEDNEERLVVAKGIIRPRLTNKVTGESETNSTVVEAAFGKKMEEAAKGKFHIAKEIGAERCNMGHQTVLFSTFSPAKVIRRDTKRIKKMTALDLLGYEDSRKVKAGLSPSLLLQEMAPWKMMQQYDIPGIRATAYGSSLVPKGSEYGKQRNTVLEDAFREAGFEPSDEYGNSVFMLLPGTAKRLAERTASKVEGMIGKTYLIHRDPALPDGTSLFPSVFAGVLDWSDDDVQASSGVILNPLDPYWKAAGGDFDGDSAAIFMPSKNLVPRGSVSREDYKLNGRKYVAEEVGEQMLEASVDTVVDLLGPTILGTMCLFERGADTNTIRNISAAVAQASVQAKKHHVDIEEVRNSYATIRSEVSKNSDYGEYPYIGSYLNMLKNAPGTKPKIEGWEMLINAINAGVWDNGTDIEHALIDRALAINTIFKDMYWFREVLNPKLPQSMVNAAIAETPAEVATQIKSMAEEYRSIAYEIIELSEDVDYQDEDSGGMMEDLRNNLKILRTQFKLAATTGNIDGLVVTPDVAQKGLIAYGPAKLAARFVPAEIFEELGQITKRIIVNIVGTRWTDGEYETESLKPIPNCKRDFEVFARNTAKCRMSVIREAPNSTRVVLESVG